MSDVSIDQLKEEFGGNEWLVDELYQKFLADPSSVDEKWRSLFEQVKPSNNEKPAAPTANKPAAPAAAKEPAKPASSPKHAAPAAKQEKPAATPAQASPAVRPSRQKSQLPAQPAKKEDAPSDPSATKVERLRGPARAIAKNMDESLTVPTATTVRAVPAKLLIDNRIVINNHLRRARGGKVSFTHLIGYAICRALKLNPSMNVGYDEEDGKPVAVHHAQVNFGIAIDLPRPDGSRLLVVPNIKGAENMTFSTFWETYEDIVKRGREGKLTAEDYAGTTVSLTNPGGLGTVHSVPRLSKGQATIIGVGALDYPAEYRGTSEKVKARNAVGKIITLTSTYDHRVIQGAASGEFLREIENQLLSDEFWDDVFEQLRIPYVPVGPLGRRQPG